MEDVLGTKLRRLGKLLGQQERGVREIEKLKDEVASLMGIGTGIAAAQAVRIAEQTTPAPEPSPRKEQPVAPAAEPKPKSEARAKQGKYMGLVRSLSEKDRKLVSTVREGQGIDDAILLAQRIRGKIAEKRGEAPPDFDETEGFTETGGDGEPSFEDIT